MTLLVFYATGVTPNMLNQSPTTLNLPPLLLSEVQRVVILNNCSVVRKFLNHEDHLTNEDADNPYTCHFTMFPGLYTHIMIA